MTRACPAEAARIPFRLGFILSLGIAGVSATSAGLEETPRASLTVLSDIGEPVEMPLRKTSDRAEISAFVARVQVEQIFANPLDVAIEARYVFPLPERSAVDGFVMTIGERRIQGEIHRREEAATIYRHARDAGHATALLEQERPNIFTQSVANIPPGRDIRVELSYVEFLVYEGGSYKFNFPMVVGPRYIPGSVRAASYSMGDSGESLQARRIVDPRAVETNPPVDRVADAARITPPVFRPGFIPSNTVDLELSVDTGTPLASITSESHEIHVRRRGASGAVVRLARRDVIPNQDFILTLGVASDEPALGLLAHRSNEEGYFALRLQPPAETSAEEAAPKEIIFVVDVSGSMSGVPIEMSRRLMKRALENLGPLDTFNIVLFSNRPSPLAPRSLPSTAANVALGQKAVREVGPHGGTEMREALRAAFALPMDPTRLRMVLLLTDGFVGNETELFDVARTLRNDARVFCLGVGTSVNHYLLRELAEIGHGAYTYVRPDGDAAAAVDRFNDWVTRPFLTDLEIDWGSLSVEDIRPERLPDLHSGQTLTLVGRYLWEGRDTVIVRGRMGGRPWESSLDVVLPERSESHEALGSVWARERIRELMLGATGKARRDVEMQVTSLALAFRLMSPYTSFVAVDSTEISNPGEAPVLWEQALAMPQYVSFTGCFGPSGPRVGPALAVPAVVEPEVMEKAAQPAKGEQNGSIQGRVLDIRGAALSGVPVQLRRPSAPNSIWTVITDLNGNYRFDNLSPEPGYVLFAEYPGFVSMEMGPFDLRGRRHAAADLTLRDGGEVTETIEVFAQGSRVNTDSTKSSTTFNTEFVEGPSIIGRNYQDILTVAPGATDTDGDGNPNVQGARETGLQHRLDSGVVAGVAGGLPSGSITDPVGGTFGPNLNIDAIEEIEVVTAGAAASFGCADGGFANIATRSGTGSGAPDREIETLALRILADLADDRRLSRAEGLPALAALLVIQSADGRFSGRHRTNALATWALAESAALEPELPWVREALARAASAWESVAATEGSSETPGAVPPVGRAGPWTRLALAALASCRGQAPDPARPDEKQRIAGEARASEVDLNGLLGDLDVLADPLIDRLVERILDGDRPGPACLRATAPRTRRSAHE